MLVGVGTAHLHQPAMRPQRLRSIWRPLPLRVRLPVQRAWRGPVTSCRQRPVQGQVADPDIFDGCRVDTTAGRRYDDVVLNNSDGSEFCCLLNESGRGDTIDQDDCWPGSRRLGQLLMGVRRQLSFHWVVTSGSSETVRQHAIQRRESPAGEELVSDSQPLLFALPASAETDCDELPIAPADSRQPALLI